LVHLHITNIIPKLVGLTANTNIYAEPQTTAIWE